MSEQVILRITMELLSDTIFGSGFSIPGGEDIAVCRDSAGYPYLKGSTLKGLLRESLENYLVWTDGSETELFALLGESGWSGMDDSRRIHLTDLTLGQRPADPEECFSTRMFTSLEDGVVKTGTLRMASCIHSGQYFFGNLICREEDIQLLSAALSGIKWVGTMRSRGFGRVRVSSEFVGALTAPISVCSATRCIHYRLHTQAPVLITDLGHSQSNSYKTRGYIPGSAVRGMVASTLAAENPTWFQEHRIDLLSEKTRFLDAVPVVEGLAPLPSIKGFYEDKQESSFESVVKNGTFPAGFKRANLGSFCALDGNIVRYWSAGTDSATRIGRDVTGDKEKAMFQTGGLSAGQDFEGYVLFDEPAIAQAVSTAISGTVWLGADRYDGFGKCAVTLSETADAPAWIGAYGCRQQEELGEKLYLLVLSPLTMLDETGAPCGIDQDVLAQKLGVKEIKITFCSTSMEEFGGYNRAWKCRASAVNMYDRGSIFQIICDRVPSIENIRSIERSGLGIRRAEGFGQVLFLRPALFEELSKKEPVRRKAVKTDAEATRTRRAKYIWVMKNRSVLTQSPLSRSQIGTIQSLCEKAMANGGELTELKTYLDKNLTERGARHGSRFLQIGQLMEQVLGTPLAETIGAPCEDSIRERLKLLCLLFDFSRKEREVF